MSFIGSTVTLGMTASSKFTGNYVGAKTASNEFHNTGNYRYADTNSQDLRFNNCYALVMVYFGFLRMSAFHVLGDADASHWQSKVRAGNTSVCSFAGPFSLV